MPYETKNFERLLGTPGFSDALLKNHFSLYQGYVTNLNKSIETLNGMLKEGKGSLPEFAELKRRFGWEFNGMRLHEFYFGNMRKDKMEMNRDSALARKIKEDFGSYENWEKDFKATGSMRGIGWAALYYDGPGDRLWNVWINEHDAGHLAGTGLIMIMDVFEHAFMIDYGVKKPDYIAALFNALCWNAAEERFEACMAAYSQHARRDA